jgi:peptide/nickel transport system substrate-binding protein
MRVPLRPRLVGAALGLAALSLVGAQAASSGARQSTAPVDGGVLRAAIGDNPDHLDTGIGFAVEGWELTEATGNGLVKFKDAPGAGSSAIVPDLALAMPKVTDGGKTYTFTVTSKARFAPPVNRAVQPSDIKYAIERLFHVSSPGVGFYSDIVGADAFGKKLKGGIAGIVADDTRHTIVFHLQHPDGAFLDILAMPFAFAVPQGMPYRDISTDARWRVGTGPYVITSYVPKQRIVLKRNPNFHQWTANSPRGHLDEIDVQIGVTPEQAVNETSNGQLDWYVGAVPSDRLRALQAQYPKQVHLFPRNNDTYFLLNERKPPFTKLAVRQAVNYATDRHALVKIFGGQGLASETVLPPGFGGAYREHTLYPLDLAKAKALIKQAGAAGAKVQIWAPNTDPAPKAAQYEASVLSSIGLDVTGVKLVAESVYYDELLSQKSDPQMALTQFDQDYPEGEDFIDTLLNGANITNVGNNNTSNTNDPVLNKLIDQTKLLPLGPKRDAAWAQIDRLFMARDAGWVPIMHRLEPKFVSPKLNGLVFTGSYFELIPELWLAK